MTLMEEEEVTERRTPRGSEGASRKKQNIEDYYRMGGAWEGPVRLPITIHFSCLVTICCEHYYFILFQSEIHLAS